MSVRRKKPDLDKTVFSAGEACWYIGICWDTLLKLIRNGEIMYRQIGRRYLIGKNACDSYMAQDSTKARLWAKSLLLK
jgi:excisionase family DNA binding protein